MSSQKFSKSVCPVVAEYAFYWSLYQDGTIDYQIKLTGELSTNQLSAHELDSGLGEFGTIVTPGVNAQNHQHMFCARLDFAVDCEDGGRSLVVTEVCDKPQYLVLPVVS